MSEPTEAEQIVAWRDRIGRKVIFTYNHGEREEGVVTSVNARYVFVRFGAHTTSEACDPANLSLAVAGVADPDGTAFEAFKEAVKAE